MVEAALVLPLVLMIVFGLVEFGLLFKDELTVSSAAGAGAREGAALSKVAEYQDEVVDQVQDRLAATSPQDGDKLVIYKVDPDSDNGLPAFAGSQGEIFSGCLAGADNPCYAYQWQSGSFELVPGSPDWTASEQSTCRDEVLDEIGVFLEITHDFFIPMFGGSDRLVTERNTFQLEPDVAGQCEPS